MAAELINGRHADIATAQGWLNEARGASSQNSELTTNRMSPAEQQQLVQRAWNALSNVFIALNLVPSSTLIYANAMGQAYGPGVLRDKIPLQSREEYTGSFAQQTTQIYNNLHRSNPINVANTDLWVRMRLNDAGRVVANCPDIAVGGPCNLTGLYTGHAMNGVETHEWPLGDWGYFSWADGPFIRSQFAPPLVWFLRLVRDIATRLASVDLRSLQGRTIEQFAPRSTSEPIPLRSSGPKAVLLARKDVKAARAAGEVSTPEGWQWGGLLFIGAMAALAYWGLRPETNAAARVAR